MFKLFDGWLYCCQTKLLTLYLSCVAYMPKDMWIVVVWICAVVMKYYVHFKTHDRECLWKDNIQPIGKRKEGCRDTIKHNYLIL